MGSESKRVNISGFKGSEDENEIRKLFEKHGRIERLSLKEGDGYVEFSSEQEAKEAAEALDGTKFNESRINVELEKRKRSPSREKKREPSSRDKCYCCGDYGHWASKCPKGDGAGVGSGKCFKCGQRGHIARRCNSRRGRGRSRSRSRSYSRSSSRSRSSRSSSHSRSRRRRSRSRSRSSRHR
eukprot:TRINITY_DN0_c7103_g1_i1.p1 TRINITY_DN0_c7103_g1~~TRINITY_DN0_c7103_g1_i1.p1  ORF type:complete len:183 (+),score=22.24 TRINITY_DN0_c7103_g1_i1:47-595(+)